MNRREFCLSLGAVVAGGTVTAWGHGCDLAAEQTEPVLSHRFRAKMTYSEQWHDHFAHLAVDEQQKGLREELLVLSGRLDALILNDHQNVSSLFLGLLVAESSHAGLELYLPARFPLSATVWNPASMQIHALTFRDQLIRRVETVPDFPDGFIFVVPGDARTIPIQGVVLCDRSRCRWQMFLCHRLHGVEDMSHVGLDDVRKLQTARWLDFAQKQLMFKT